MFLKEPEQEDTGAGVVWQAGDVVIRHPVRLQIRRWVVRFGDHWVVAGRADTLSALAGLLREGGEHPDVRIACVSTEPPAPAERPGLWQRLLNRLRPPRPPSRSAGLFDEWVDGLNVEDELERRLLRDLDEALGDLPGLLVLDRIVRLLRTQVRFRVSATLHEWCNDRGLAVVVLDERLPEGWGGCNRAALLTGGRLQPVMRSDLP